MLFVSSMLIFPKKTLAPLDIFYTNLYIDGHGNITLLEMFSSLNDLGLCKDTEVIEETCLPIFGRNTGWQY